MMRVMLVEDEPWLAELYRDILESSGYAVAWCRDGYEAMERVDESRPDAIVLDLQLPWANGIQLLHELGSHNDLAGIPIIIYSNAVPQTLDHQVFDAYGVRAVLDKAACAPQQLPQAVSKVLRHGA